MLPNKSMLPSNGDTCPVVALVDVDAPMVERLLALATTDADADDVTPPIGSTPGPALGWTSERIAWFNDYHRAATGLDSPAKEKTWAIVANGMVAGSVRLERTGPGVVETGIWLGRAFRTRGLGRQAA